MATQEERLAALEEKHIALSREVGQRSVELSMELVVLKGLVSQDVVLLRELREEMRARFERVERRFDGVDAHLGSVMMMQDTRMGKLEERLAEHAGLLMQILARLPEKKDGEG